MRRFIQTTGVIGLSLLLKASSVFAQGAGIEWEILNQEVMDLYHAGEYDRAVIIARKALEIAEKNVGPYHPHVAASLNDLGLVYHDQGQNALAEPLLKRALAIVEKVRGPDHPSVATTLNNLALLYDDLGNYAKAEPLYKRALAIDEKALGPDHPFLIKQLLNSSTYYSSSPFLAFASP